MGASQNDRTIDWAPAYGLLRLALVINLAAGLPLIYAFIDALLLAALEYNL
jgi:hypothetical protein